MNEKKRNRLDFLQNMLIVALSLFTVVLLTQTQLYELGSTVLRQNFGSLLEPSAADSNTDEAAVIPATPVHVAVSGAYGRYGDMTLVSSDEDFRPLGDLLKEALGSARTASACTQAEFLDALNSTSIYYDFLTDLPLSVLAELTGTSTENSLSVRRIVLSDRDSQGVCLFLQDENGGYQVCSTAVSRGDLETATGSYELGNAVFAFELAETEGSYVAVDPCSLFLTDSASALPVLLTEDVPADTSQTLTVLQFNPRTNYRYPESDGTEVIVEGERSLRIHPDGTLLYRSGGEHVLTIDAANSAAPTLQEAVAGTGALLQRLASDSGDAQLYLQNLQQSGDTITLRFGFHANGIPIRFSDDTCAAEVTLTGSTVSTLSLRFRRYTVSSESSLLLPLRQALAIAASGSGAELSVGYADNGAGQLAACWLAD